MCSHSARSNNDPVFSSGTITRGSNEIVLCPLFHGCQKDSLVCVTAADEVTEGTGKFQAKGASHGWGGEVLLIVKSRTNPGAKGCHLVLQEERPSEITLRNPELDVVAELECPFAEAKAHALSLTILDA
jgi:hypothetical protein